MPQLQGVRLGLCDWMVFKHSDRKTSDYLVFRMVVTWPYLCSRIFNSVLLGLFLLVVHMIVFSHVSPREASR